MVPMLGFLVAGALLFGTPVFYLVRFAAAANNVPKSVTNPSRLRVALFVAWQAVLMGAGFFVFVEWLTHSGFAVH